MKRLILLSLILLNTNLYANEAAGVLSAHTAVNSAASTPSSLTQSSLGVVHSAGQVTAAIVVGTANGPKRHLTPKQKIQQLWSKIINYDFANLNILKKVEEFVAGKKKQNVEAIAGAETGELKHTKRMPTSGTAKEIAEKLDKAQQDVLKRYESVTNQ